ncbi:MAG: hypothetical protein ACD_20C00357G0022 [uncultured bacterium]|nr:MAG: hypothetical protein ACD_20C00357G0022 [uncultured bacterium]HBH17903.1 hypothetical protein [Cyanobacteria bacterium UBA9579]
MDFWCWLVNTHNEIYEKVAKIMREPPGEFYEREEECEEDYLRTHILPEIPIGVIKHYINSLELDRRSMGYYNSSSRNNF